MVHLELIELLLISFLIKVKLLSILENLFIQSDFLVDYLWNLNISVLFLLILHHYNPPIVVHQVSFQKVPSFRNKFVNLHLLTNSLFRMSPNNRIEVKKPLKWHYNMMIRVHLNPSQISQFSFEFPICLSFPLLLSILNRLWGFLLWWNRIISEGH